MYIILNSQLKRIGTLSNRNNGATPFYNDQITQQIADDDQQLSLSNVPDNTNIFNPNGNSKNWGHTLDQIFVPYGFPDTDKIREGNSLAYQDPHSHRWYVMRLTSVMDATDVSGNHYKQATGVNLCIWKLGKTVHYSQTFTDCNSKTAFRNLFMNTGWLISTHSDLVGGSADVSFDGASSSQAMLQQLCQTYGAEIDAFVVFPQATKMGDGRYLYANFDVAEKVVEIKRQLGTDKGDRIVYGRNATNIQRNVIDDSLYTRLYVHGKSGTTCACSRTEGEPYVEDRTANKIYNPPLGDFAENFLEGAITSQTMDDPERLTDWGLKQLKLFNHPRANYTVTASHQLDTEDGGRMVMKAGLGDVFRVIDEKMDPVLHAETRVIRKQLSFSNPTLNNITLGEYTTVNVVPPTFISNLQQGLSNRVTEILDAIHNNPGALSCTVDKPDGVSWAESDKVKRFIAHVYVLGEDITDYIDTKGFIWELWQDGQSNDTFAKKHAGDGNTLKLTNDLQIDTNLLPPDQNDNGSATNPDDNGSKGWTGSGTFDETSGESSTDMFDEITNGTNDIAGIVRLSIDTDYIENKQATNFNTRKSHQVFTVGEWSDLWNDPREGALQYVNYNPNDHYYYCSLVYYGQWRPRQAHHKKKNGGQAYGPLIWGQGRKDQYDPNKLDYLVGSSFHTEIARLDRNGHYVDSMIIPFSHHNSNFGLDYTHTNGQNPYIWTTVQAHKGDGYYIVRLQYQPGVIAAIEDLDIPSSVSHLSPLEIPRLLHYGEPGCMVNYDNSSDMVVFSHDDVQTSPAHTVDFYKAQDLLDHTNASINDPNAPKPVHSINLTDYGFVPKMEDYEDSNGDLPQDNSSQQTFQSCCLRYPYFFFDSGNMNMSDQRMIYGIDISTGGSDSFVFSKPIDLDDLMISTPNEVIGNNPGNYVFAEPETINWTYNDNGDLVFLFGMNVGFENDKASGNSYDANGIPEPNYKHFEQLYQIGFDIHKDKNSNGQPDHTHGQPNQPDPSIPR